MTTRVAVMLQARMGSTRLPGKVLMPLGGRPLLGWIAERMARSRFHPVIAVSTGLEHADDAIEAFCADAGYACFRGPVDDIVGRLHGVASGLDCEYLVRVWGDCPFVCVDIVDAALQRMADDGLAFVGTDRVGARNLPYGLDFEIYAREVIDAMGVDVPAGGLREFPVEYLLAHVDRGRLGLAKGSRDRKDLTLSVDYPEDYEAARSLAAALLAASAPATYDGLLATLERDPELAKGFSKAARNVEYRQFLSTRETEADSS